MTIDGKYPLVRNLNEELVVISGDVKKIFRTLQKEKKVYFKCEENTLSVVTKDQFNALDVKQKETVVKGLENVIANKELHRFAKVINALRSIRNEIFITLNPSENGFSTLHNDLLEKLILGRTSPNQIEAAKLINRQLKRVATHRAKINSINNGSLCLKKALPAKIKTTDEALQWLERDKDACYFLRYADFKGFNDFNGFKDFNEKHLEKLIEICPNLTHLFIQSQAICRIEMLPPSLRVLNCNNCRNLRSLSNLPASLTRLICYACDLRKLPSLPASLIELVCSHSSPLEELPELPASLVKLDCSYSFERLRALPQLPSSLTELICYRCEKLEELPNLPDSLTILNCNDCYALTELSKFPHSLKELDCMDCASLTKLSEFPASLEILNCRGCKALTELSKLPPSLWYFDRTGCHALTNQSELPAPFNKLRGKRPL